ncbi:MAG: DNA mismatch repair endonuclease MutL [Bacteroidales bacterium]
MSDVIKLLPDSVANQIAAGEVIQRPASVIKELVENAVDAGATSIQVLLIDAGRTLIQVIDNGLGMSDTDARLAFERHSTSKIRGAGDLFALQTMGFRGEALASIAAIAHVELRTRRAEDTVGSRVVISASKVELQEAVSTPVGSNFMIKNIFFNVPARRKFLKNNQVELSNIAREFERLALINCDVEISLVHNDKIMYKLGVGNFKQRIIALFGHSFESQLIPISLETSLISIDGFICRPENARKRNAMQFFYANGRYMKHPYFYKAVVTAYDQLIPADEQPNYFIRYRVEPDTIDVNIHPTKTEIKFENELPIWQIINAAVKESLGRFSAMPSIDFDTEGAPDIPIYSNKGEINQPTIEIDPSYNPFTPKGTGAASFKDNGYMKQQTKDWDQLYSNFQNNGADNIVTDELQPDSGYDTTLDTYEGLNPQMVADENEFSGQELVQSKLFTNDTNASSEEIDFSADYMQLNKRYIVSKVKSGLMIVDQHRAHVRVLFDKFNAERDGEFYISAQRVMFPEVLHLSVAQDIIIRDLLSDIQQIGFDLSDLGNNSWAINSVPQGVDATNHKELVMEVIDTVVNGGERAMSKLSEEIALTVAKRAAIPYGRVLNQREMEVLMSDLLLLSKPNYTPDGKSIINVISLEHINKLF